MIASSLYNIGIFIVGGVIGSVMFILIRDLEKIRENRVLTPMNKITQLFNPGFYLGSAGALSFIVFSRLVLTRRPVLYIYIYWLFAYYLAIFIILSYNVS